MDFKLDYLEDWDLMSVKTHGEMNAADYLAMAKELLHHPKSRTNGNVIFDHTQLDFSKVTLEVLEKIRAFHLKNEKKIGSGKSAFVIKPGFLEKWHKLWSQGNKIKAQNQVKVFESYAEALKWVVE